jgi:hypothetical protein
MQRQIEGLIFLALATADNEASHNNRHDAGHAKVNEPYGRCLARMTTSKKHDQGLVIT